MQTRTLLLTVVIAALTVVQAGLVRLPVLVDLTDKSPPASNVDSAPTLSRDLGK